MAAPRTPLEEGLAGRYRIERELGRGGMATVYLAHDLRHDRPVALKVLHPELAHAVGPERFQREIHVVARLQHPHILTVHDSGDAAGQLWFTMPFVEGESLRSRLDREAQLPVGDAVRIAREAADALDYAHRHGVVHRDIKPDNILLSEGHALVADFGIARALGAGGGDERLTVTGTSVGTAAYMSPEQAAGERDVDARSDIYSLAIVLYEMLAGVTPFAAATPQATIARRFTDTPAPLRTVRATVPEYVERAVAQALARTAADRFPTARAFADALAAPETASATVASPVAVPRPAAPRHWHRSALAILVIGLVIGGGGLFAWSRLGPDDPSTAQLRAGSSESRAVRLAVLPFDNLGDSADAYFADGVTDAVRGKLAEIKGLEVIARNSSQEYRGGTKPQEQIASELRVDYLLTGTVRWVKQADGTSRVQVRPELVEIGDGVARTRWGQPFNAPLTDVFEVQEQIAGQVSGALDIALGTSDRQRLAERPTQNLAAYDLYLQAQATPSNDQISSRRNIGLLERAVTLDPAFGRAWARLASARSNLWATGITKPTEQELSHSLERATTLAPTAPETYGARMSYASAVKRNFEEMKAIGVEAVAQHPGNPGLIASLGYARVQTGEVEAGVADLQRAVTLDPRNARLFANMGLALAQIGRVAESRVALQQVLEITPANLAVRNQLVESWLRDGDVAAARRLLNEGAPAGGRPELLAYTAMFGDKYWLLDRAQQDTLLTAGLEPFDGDSASRALALAEILHARGDSAAARRWADIARRGFEALGPDFDDSQVPGLIGMAYAYQGRHADALRWLDRGIAESRAAEQTVGYTLELKARGLLLAGRHDEAIAALEEAVTMKDGPMPRFLAIDGHYEPLRTNPRFQRLVAVGR